MVGRQDFNDFCHAHNTKLLCYLSFGPARFPPAPSLARPLSPSHVAVCEGFESILVHVLYPLGRHSLVSVDNGGPTHPCDHTNSQYIELTPWCGHQTHGNQRSMSTLTEARTHTEVNPS